MNEKANKLFWVGDKFMPKMHLRQPEFTYSACGPYTKYKESIQELKKQEIQDIFIKTNYTRSTLNTIWLMENLIFYPED